MGDLLRLSPVVCICYDAAPRTGFTLVDSFFWDWVA